MGLIRGICGKCIDMPLLASLIFHLHYGTKVLFYHLGHYIRKFYHYNALLAPISQVVHFILEILMLQLNQFQELYPIKILPNLSSSTTILL